MKRDELKLGMLLRLWAVGTVLFGASGVAMVLLLQWAERKWPPEDVKHIEEAERRPDHAHFRPLDGPSPPVARTGLTYVPVYSTLYLGDREIQAGLAVTLSLRNTSPDRDLVVHRVNYYDSAGALTLRLADQPHAVPTLATAEFFIDRRDPTGGPGANYLVEWSIADGGTDPLIEAVMVGQPRNAGITFVSRGVVVRDNGRQNAGN